MELRLDILRQESPGSEPYLQSIVYSTDDLNATVASALAEINLRGFSDTNGRPVGEIAFEHSCLQKKCGACAIVIGGTPRLACGARLSEFEKSGSLEIRPLRKFPVVRDLIVDRSVMFDDLREIRLWAETELAPPDKTDDIAYEASRCLQCGCCLEVCPNFYPGGRFMGMAAAVPSSRLIEQLGRKERGELARAYSRHFYSGCGKSLACRSICPAGIDIEGLLVNSNAAAVWKWLRKK